MGLNGYGSKQEILPAEAQNSCLVELIEASPNLPIEHLISKRKVELIQFISSCFDRSGQLVRSSVASRSVAGLFA